jgi:hypothetical protein
VAKLSHAERQQRRLISGRKSYAKNKDNILAAARKAYVEDPDRFKRYRAEYQARYPDRASANRRRASAKYLAANIEKVRDNARKRQRQEAKDISNYYVRGKIRASARKKGLSLINIPQPIIALKRAQLRLHRAAHQR